MTREELTAFIKNTKGKWCFTTESGKEVSEDDVIKALEQEPCEDAISRANLKKRLQEHHDFFVNAYGGFRNLPPNDKSRVDEITNCIAEVVNMPSVNMAIETLQEKKWIPVTTPPKENGRYLVTRKCLSTSIVDIVSYSTNLYKVNKYEFYNKKEKGGWWKTDSEYGSYEVDGVIGWQELPKTMESEGEE